MSQHSETFIQEMKERLIQEQADLKREIETEEEFPEYGRHEDENAAEVADYSASAATEEALEARLREVEDALRRMEEGTYGVTAKGDLIPEDRLRANPAATTLVTE